MNNHQPGTLNRITIIIISSLMVSMLLFAGMALMTRADKALANSNDINNARSVYPISGTRLDSCSLCHTASIPALNAFGADYKNNGRSTGALGAIANLDSDGDSFTNFQEIQALTFPGDPNDRPVAAATATPIPTATRPPATATSVPPTATRPPATATSVPPTATRPPATATGAPPATATVPPPPTNTPVVIPPTATQVLPPGATATMQPSTTPKATPQCWIKKKSGKRECEGDDDHHKKKTPRPTGLPRPTGQPKPTRMVKPTRTPLPPGAPTPTPHHDDDRSSRAPVVSRPWWWPSWWK
jgi:hypothetical protein